MKLPCVVQARDALKQLAKWNRRVVTLDATGQRLYLGSAPIIKKTLRTPLFKPEREVRAVQSGEGPTRLRDLPVHANFMKDLDGWWLARPHVPYSPFQVDYYRKAFRWFERTLNEMEWPSLRTGRPRPVIMPRRTKSKHHVFYVSVDRGLCPTRDFFRRLAALEDFEFLMSRRWEGFARVERFVAGLESLTAENVRQVVNGLVELLGWTSMGYGFREAFKEIHLSPQARYVSDAFLPLLLRAAYRNSAHEDALTAKHKQLAAVFALLRRSPRARRAVMRHDFAGLQHVSPEAARRMEQISERFKANTEDVRVLSDIDTYVGELTQMLRRQHEGLPLEQLAEFCRPYLDERRMRPEPGSLLREIRRRDPDLLLILNDHGAETTRDGDRGGVAGTIALLAAIIKRTQEQESLERTVRHTLNHYPRLRRVLALAQNESVFRNTSHHLITRCQRKIAKLMLNTASRFPEIFDAPGRVFEIDGDELMALLRDPNPAYTRLTFERRPMEEEAEMRLEERWREDPTGARVAYGNEIQPVIDVLARQTAAARCGEVQRHYREEIRRLRGRIEALRLRPAA
jgi:hypothetical protein